MMNDPKIMLEVGNKFSFQFQGRKNDLALFTSLGSAVAQIQSFETQLLATLGFIKEEKSSENFYNKTMGALIKALNKSFPDSDISTLLEEVRNRRNRLIHSLLRDYQWPIMSDDDYVKAIQDIESTRSFIENASLELSKYLSDRSIIELVVFNIDHESGEINQLI